MFGHITIAAGESKRLYDVPAGTAIGVVPGGGGTMKVEYRISEGGPLRAWPPGTVAVATDDFLRSPVRELVVTATTVDGLAEFNAPSDFNSPGLLS